MKPKKALFIILFTGLSSACAVSRISNDKITAEKIEGVTFPLDATIMVTLQNSSNNKNIQMNYGYNQTAYLTPREDSIEATINVLQKYFKKVEPVDASKPTNFVLTLTPSSKLDVIIGTYQSEIDGRLLDPMGNILFQGKSKASEMSGVLNDKNAFYNSFVKSVSLQISDIMKQKGKQLASLSKSNPPSLINFTSADVRNELKVHSTGSGFYANSNGDIITSHHVVEGCFSISIKHGSTETPATIHAADENVDIAILKTGKKSPYSAAIADPSTNPLLGEDILTIGFPLSDILSSGPNLTTGNISALTGLKNESSSLQITAPVQPGNSGGPLLNKRGEVIGVVKSKLDAIGLARHTGDIAQNVNFSVNNQSLTAFLKANNTNYLNSNQIAPLETTKIADIASKYTVQIICKR